MNGDGFPDITLAGNTIGLVQVFLGDGNGDVSSTNSFNAAMGPYSTFSLAG